MALSLLQMTLGGGGAKCLKKHEISYLQTIAHNALKESDFL